MAGVAGQSWAREAGVGRGKAVPGKTAVGDGLAGTRAAGMAGRSWAREAGVGKGKAVPSRMGKHRNMLRLKA